MKFLIVDDSPAIQIIVRRSLEKEGFSDSEFRSASSGAAALEVMSEWSPDLVITDWHMPGMTGLELLQLVQQTYTRRHLVGFITTESVPERLNEAARNGAAFILSKPFTEQQLGNAVRNALSAHEAAMAKEAAAQAAEKAQESAKEASASLAGEFFVSGAPTIEKYLQQAINMRVKLQEVAAVDFHKMAMPCYLVFYGLGDNSAIRAFCVLDHEAYKLFGASQTREGSSPEANAAQVTALLGEASHALFNAPPTQPVKVLRSQLLAQLTPKLLELLDKKLGRTCFSVIAPGHPPGLMTLIAR